MISLIAAIFALYLPTGVPFVLEAEQSESKNKARVCHQLIQHTKGLNESLGAMDYEGAQGHAAALVGASAKLSEANSKVSELSKQLWSSVEDRDAYGVQEGLKDLRKTVGTLHSLDSEAGLGPVCSSVNAAIQGLENALQDADIELAQQHREGLKKAAGELSEVAASIDTETKSANDGVENMDITQVQKSVDALNKTLAKCHAHS